MNGSKEILELRKRVIELEKALIDAISTCADVEATPGPWNRLDKQYGHLIEKTAKISDYGEYCRQVQAYLRGEEVDQHSL